MSSVYILYSPTTEKFYIGSCQNLIERLNQHRSKFFTDSFTAQMADDWELFLSIDNLQYEQARNIELHIKKMKSRKYIFNLKQYPEMINKLCTQYH